MKIFQNYHRHSMFTNVKVPDSTATNQEYATRAKELGHGIISSMEHGWQGNYYDTYKIAKQNGLRPVIGAEAYWVKDRFTQDSSNCHIYIGAKNENGRQALNDIISEANLTGYYRQARIDVPLILSLPKDDVIVTTACLAYWKYPDIDEITKEFANHFRDNFFLEVQYHNTQKQRELNRHIVDLHNKLKIPLIMGCDSHFIHSDNFQTRKDFLFSKNIEYPDEEGWYLDYPDGDEAYRRFANQCVLSHSEINDAIDNTNVFLDVEEYDTPIFNTEIKMPSLYPGYTQEQKDKEYKKLVWQGWKSYRETIPRDQWELYESEILKEIQTVIDTKMADYFIDDYYIIKKGKENGGWLTKSGRGSAVSFVTNMLLGFTEVDRIAAKVHMYPERFMSTTRILQSGSLPDIDQNCANVAPFAKAQQEVLGEDHAYPMIAYGTMQKSAAWKLYAKSQGIPFEIANTISDQLKKYEKAVKHASEDEKDDVDVRDYIGKEFWEIYEKSKDYLGLITSWSIAPCSYLLYQGSIRKEIGLVKIKDHLCCLMDGHWAEECHFLKNDLLKVSVVDSIYRTYQMLGTEPPNVQTLLEQCTSDDPAWDIYKRGCTIGINQVEQSGTASRVAKYSPHNISELAAFVAAIRPGFKSMYKQFESREPFSYGVKAFDDLIQTEEMPNSYILYQEQEMAALNYAGIDMSDCYTAIKNIAKKRAEKVLAYKDKFISGFTKTMTENEGKTEEEATELVHKLWQIIEDSASYSFNASHSYCVALDSLYGAWLKAHHPLEFYSVQLTLAEEKGDKDKMNALKAEAEDYFNIVFPPFRFGQDNSKITPDLSENTINNTIASIKGFSSSVGSILYEVSKLHKSTFVEVLKELDSRGLKTASVRPLILIDYFQQYGLAKQLIAIQDAWDLFKQGDAKQLKFEKISPLLQTVLAQLDVPKGKTFYRVDGLVDKILAAYEEIVLEQIDTDYPLREKMNSCLEILGYVDIITNKESDRKRLLVIDAFPLPDKQGNPWAYRLTTKSIGSGKTARLTVKTSAYNKLPIKAGDIVYAAKLWKNAQGYWYLLDYHLE